MSPMRRRLNHIALVFGKELKETLRDRRTLAVMVLFPLVVYPLLSLLIGQVVTDREARYEDKPLRVAVSPEATVRALLAAGERDGQFKLAWVEGAGPTDVGTQKLDLYIEETTPKKAPPSPIRLVFDSSREESIRAEQRISTHLGKQLVPGSAYAFDVGSHDVGTPAAKGGYLLSKVVPLLVALMVILGAFYPAIDTTAGERERGTLETTLVAPIARTDLLTGKVLAVATLALVTGLANLGSLSATFVQLARTADADGLPLPWGRLAATALILPPAAIMFAAVMVMAATAAKSFKEAQNYLTPIYFLFFAPAVAASLGEFPLTLGAALVPGLNLTLLSRDLILGEAGFAQTAMFVASSLAVTALALSVASRLFDSERLLAVDTRKKRTRGRAAGALPRAGQPEARPLDAADGAVGFALAVIVFWLLAPFSQRHMLAGTLVSQWVGMAGLALAYVRVRGLPLAPSLALSWPSRVHVLAALALGAGAWMVVGVLTQWLLPPSPEVVRALRTMLQTFPAPVALLLFALTPALCEELLFRGLLLQAFLRRFPPGLAILLVSLLFGLFHFSLDRLLPTAVLGLLLGLATWRTGSLLPAMLIHGLNNGILVALAVSGQDQALDDVKGGGAALVLLGTLTSLAIGLWLLWRRPVGGNATHIV